MKKTLLFGNGLNYLSDFAVGWKDLLDDLMGVHKFEKKYLPNLMTYERIRLNWMSAGSGKSDLKMKIVEGLKDQPANDYYKKILKSDFQNLVTTNYDYAARKAHLELDAGNTVKNNSTEELYSIRRNTSLIDNGGRSITKIWSIHGELDFPKSIMLGMNHYCGSVGKIDRYLKGTYDFNHKQAHDKILPIEDKLEKQIFDGYSWVELFFNSEMHIAGFGFGFSEIDLWGILTKRSRTISSSGLFNKIFYYTKPMSQVTDEIEVEARKRETLESLSVNIIEDAVLDSDYKSQWDKFITRMNTCS